MTEYFLHCVYVDQKNRPGNQVPQRRRGECGRYLANPVVGPDQPGTSN
jgi:hypothetical protein